MSTENNQSTPGHISPFDTIRQEKPNAQTGELEEYWSARQLARLLGYTEYGKFKNAIQKAEISCARSRQNIEDHFAHVSDMIEIGKGGRRKVQDVHLSRYACYLIVENADPSKELVALGQTYFAVQTYLKEIGEAGLDSLPEEQKRLFLHNQLTDYNRQLAAVASQAGIVQPADFAIFQDHGYMGLYGGLKTGDIQERKGLKNGQNILDHMGSEELASNIFRSAQTSAKLRREDIRERETAQQAHLEIGRKVRDLIEEIGGTMPEDLPTPVESIRELEQKEYQRRLLRQPVQPEAIELPEPKLSNPSPQRKGRKRQAKDFS